MGETQPEIPDVPNRRLAIALSFLIPLFGLLAIFVYEQQTPPPWRLLLDNYLAEATAGGTGWRVQAVHTAQAPQGLVAALPLVPITENAYYRLTPAPVGESVGTDSRQPLPYPPSEAECIFLIDAEGNVQVLVAGHHADLHNGTWILHETSATGLSLQETLTRVGCPTPGMP